MNELTISRRWIFVMIMAGLLLGAAILGVMAISASPASAQTAGTGERESNDTDDGAEGPDTPITGSALERASTAALEYIGEGQVTETEVGDEEGYYEVEITRDNGRQVDVHLDQAFNVLGHEDD